LTSSSSLGNCSPLSSIKLRAAVGVGELLGYKEETNNWIVRDVDIVGKEEIESVSVGATVDDDASDGCMYRGK
jgi:hypothetical protein